MDAWRDDDSHFVTHQSTEDPRQVERSSNPQGITLGAAQSSSPPSEHFDDQGTDQGMTLGAVWSSPSPPPEHFEYPDPTDDTPHLPFYQLPFPEDNAVQPLPVFSAQGFENTAAQKSSPLENHAATTGCENPVKPRDSRPCEAYDMDDSGEPCQRCAKNGHKSIIVPRQKVLTGSKVLALALANWPSTSRPASGEEQHGEEQHYTPPNPTELWNQQSPASMDGIASLLV